jgi:hypothetical protein
MRLKLLFLLFFVYFSICAQTTRTLSTPSTGTFKVPAGVTSLVVEGWGAGGAGGGVVGVLSLYGGGGGGGGAYSKTTLTSITPATSFNYTVGAGGTGVSGSGGGNGGNSIFSTVTVNGGLGGGKGNPSQGVGGAGGAASGAGTIFSGGQGGTAILISGTLYSGGGGGGAGTASNGGNATNGTAGIGGNTGGGAGAPGVLLISDGVGGGSPGGGGSGGEALVGLLGNAKGGNGGDGQIKVTYTCPTYGLTATTADDVCTVIGTASTVRLTGGASLPNGDYVVTYNRSNPSLNGTGLTAVMTVSGGTGTFIATGFTVAGPSTITITNISSGIVTQITPPPIAQIPPALCSNNITSNNIVNITVSSVSVGGTVSGGGSVCSGSTSGLLTLSGQTGSVVKWQYAVAPFSIWIDILSATNSTYTSGVLTQDTRFRAVVQIGACSQAMSSETTVTVNPLPTITTNGILNDICFDTNPQMAVLPYSATTNTPVSYSIVWNPAAITAGLINQVTTVFSFLSGGGSLNTISIPSGILPNTYMGIMTVTNANCSVNLAIQLTILPKPTAPVTGIVTEPTCATPTGSLTLSGLPNSATWLLKQSGIESATYTGTGSMYSINNLAPGNYTFTVEYAGSCVSPISASVVVNNLVTNTYNGSWSNGTPTINQNLVFDSNYSSAGQGLGDINGCSCMVNSGIDVVINSNDTLSIQNEVVINNGGTLRFENNASLVQDNAAAVNSGNIIYKRTTTPMKNFDFTYWSSPVAGQTLVGLSPNTLWDKYFSYTGIGWKTEEYGIAVMEEGIGYIIRTPKAGTWPDGEHVVFPYSQEVKFIGTPHNGNLSGQSVIAGNFYLIGNPYPSAISADTFLFANPDNNAILEGTIYFWTHNTVIKKEDAKYVYSSSDYASYNGVGGTSTLPAASGGYEPTGNIASGQSFFALANADGTVVFSNEMRIQSNNNQFFKPAKTARLSLLEKHRLWLNMTNKEGAFKQLLIGYVEGATNGYDSDFDGITFDGNAYIDFYSINMGSNLVIQGRALPFNTSESVPLGYRTIIDGEFTISINKTDGMLSKQPVYLEDKLMHTINDLTQSDYIFTTGKGIFDNRFVLRYTNDTLAVDEFEKDNNVLVWIENKNIRFNSQGENIGEVFIHDISGKLVYSDSEISSSEVVISNLKFKNEVLLIKIVLANNHIISKKIITPRK